MGEGRADIELLEAWRAGDTRAGQALLSRHIRRLYLFFSNKIGDDVSDLVQRTMLGVVEGRDRLRDDAAFRPYLLRIARNQLYLHYPLVFPCLHYQLTIQQILLPLFLLYMLYVL